MSRLARHILRRDTEVRAHVTSAVRESLRELARRNNVTLSRIVRRALSDYLRRQHASGKPESAQHR